jgi:hypothetical protein
MPLSESLTAIQRLVPLVVALLIAGSTVELIRRRKLREEFAILWILASVVLIVFAVFPTLLWRISDFIGVYYLTVVALGGFGFLSLVVIHIATTISRLSDRTTQLAQRLALLERALEDAAGADAQPQARGGEAGTEA